ncbi:Glycosyltransferase involved in cell wall bisynthesis [Pustulibacterium marinum]|uniref:Glycosyltransferase involved in cell wall bisynthesis n=1 Tax=Pustulibacterium marinum TaxID=1224947 RepID=A0A1I7ETN9_9FLAO|nr:DUF1972 domain-containing protein [Pustulibacterium marinum]SFU27306.1 Glycosyltransferase involved in cell wall bisynthesis [Pustulibacterium marinum]
MKIAIIGTRGIPNYHGGFEQFAEFFSVYLVRKGHDVYVYNSHNHKYKKPFFKGVKIIHKYDAEYKMGTAGQFIYDLNCILDVRKKNFDIILQLGYTSSSVWYKLLPKDAVIITNMDGFEWKRSKYNYSVKQFLKTAERLAVISSDFLVSDSIGVQEYLRRTYKRQSKFIAYGAKLFKSPSQRFLKKYEVKPFEYDMLIARMEPENNILKILSGFTASKSTRKFLVIGDFSNAYGQYLKKKFEGDDRILFLGGIYKLSHLNNLRYFSHYYFHGHSVGGTNPSLIEAMASKAFIIAHSNIFNRTILKENAFYFRTSKEITEILDRDVDKYVHNKKIENNFKEVELNYSLDIIHEQYMNYFEDCFKGN